MWVSKVGVVHGNRRHGRSGTLLHKIWDTMIQRCTNPKSPRFMLYGGRGITVCKRWRKFENFLKDMGEKPIGLTLERKNNAKGYFPSNCCWATQKQQCRNRSNNRLVIHNGKTKTLVEWCEELEVNYKAATCVYHVVNFLLNRDDNQNPLRPHLH